jgi:hypothetical protein
MPTRRRAEHDPRQRLVRVVERLSRRRPYVTVADVERAASRTAAALPAGELPGLLECAVAESLLLKDLRTFFDRKTGQYSEQWVYRVNPRHPVAAALLADA